jgi:hypothetical protein
VDERQCDRTLCNAAGQGWIAGWPDSMDDGGGRAGFCGGPRAPFGQVGISRSFAARLESRAFGNTSNGTTLRDLAWKMSIISGRAVPKTPSAS